MEINKLDDYISKSYTVESFKKTYAHCLQPVEGQPAWPVSDRPRPEGPKEIKKPGRKKKQRTREEQEKPKTTRVSKVGTVIKCSLCKGTGHNKTSCYKRHGIASASNGARTESANPPVMASQKARRPVQLQPLTQAKGRGKCHLRIQTKRRKLKAPKEAQRKRTIQVVTLSMYMGLCKDHNLAQVLLSMYPLDPLLPKLQTTMEDGTQERSTLEPVSSWVSKIDCLLCS